MSFLDSTGVATLTSDIKAITDATYPANAAIAPPYDSTSAYAVGDFCLKDGLFYKCNTAIASGGEAWTAAHWTLTDTADNLGTKMVILAYGSSTWNDFINAYNKNAIVYCRASSNSNPATGNQTRMAFMAYVNASTPTSVEFQYYRSVNSHSATQQGDQVCVYKLDKTAGWTVTVRENYTKIVAGTGLSSSYSSGTLTLNNTVTAPVAATETPLAAGTAAVGSSVKYAREDHVHPTDTSRAAVGMGISGATAGKYLKIGAVDASGVPTSYSADSERYIVNITQSNNTYSSDKTISDIYSAITSGKDVVAVMNYKVYVLSSYGSSNVADIYFSRNEINNSSSAYVYRLCVYMNSSQETKVSFTSAFVNTPNINVPAPLEPSAGVAVRLENGTYMAWAPSSAYSDISELFGSYMHIYLSHSMGNTATENSIVEQYELSKKYIKSEYNEETGNDDSRGYLIFKKVEIANGSVLEKTFTVSDWLYEWEYLAGATVTYSEVSIPPISGVSF